ncbi:MAG: cellulase family glycosylhydrolase [Oscillospiraceae bacterium]|nr:cellulase family glycosylhydrolase [Oscillospiraceae bacterium]
MKKFLSVFTALALIITMGFPQLMFPQAEALASPPAFRDITAAQIVNEIGAGWNLGNTFDAWRNHINPQLNSTYSGMMPTEMEIIWLSNNPVNITSQALINSVRAYGFDSIRIPVTWFKACDFSGTNPTYKIRDDWMARIKEVVDMAVANDMYIILNSHHDEEIFKLTNAEIDESERALVKVWEQIAEVFKDYNEKLIFEGLNEPRNKNNPQQWNGGSAEERVNLNRLNQTFVNTIRASGGNNPQRILMVPTMAAGAAPNALSSFQKPTDTVPDKLILSIHTYAPFDFAHEPGSPTAWSPTGIGAGGPSQIHDNLNRVAARAQQLGMPVILGEWGSIHVNNDPASRALHAEYYARAARDLGMAMFWWDDGGNFRLINRATGKAFDNASADIISAIMQGAGVNINPCGNPGCRNPDCVCPDCDCGDIIDCQCEDSYITLDSLISNLSNASRGPALWNIGGYWQNITWEHRIDNAISPNMLTAFNSISATHFELTLKITGIAPLGTPIGANTVNISPDITQMGATLFRMNTTNYNDWNNHGSEKMFTAIGEEITLTMPTSVVLFNTDQVGLQIFIDESLLTDGDRASISYEITGARIIGSEINCTCIPYCCIDGPRVCLHEPSEEDCLQCANPNCDYEFATRSSLKPKCNACKALCAPHDNREAADCTICDDCGITGLSENCSNTCVACLCSHDTANAADCTKCAACNRIFASHTAGAPATCLTAQVCINCPHLFVKELGHNMPATWTVRTPATSSAAGLQFKACQREDCGYEETEAIPRTGGKSPGGGGGSGTPSDPTAPTTPAPVVAQPGAHLTLPANFTIPPATVAKLRGDALLPAATIRATAAGNQTVNFGTAADVEGQNAVLVRIGADGELEVVSAATISANGQATVNVPAAGDYIVVTRKIGDVTGTGEVQTADALALLRHIAGISELNSVQLFAANGKVGDINTADALNILKIIAGL